VRVPYSEGVAKHTDPLSCIGHRELSGKALAVRTVDALQYAVEASGVEFINGEKPDVCFTRPLQRPQKRSKAELQTRPRENDRCMTRQLVWRSSRSSFIGKPSFDQRLIGNIPLVSRNLNALKKCHRQA
jgi:hypothetical protein